MIPLSDNGKRRGFPWITVLLLLGALAVYCFYLGAPLSPSNLEPLTGSPTSRSLAQAFSTGGLLQLIFVVVTLWIYARGVEDGLGRATAAVVFLATALGTVAVGWLADGSAGGQLLAAASGASALIGLHLTGLPGARIVSLIAVPLMSGLLEVRAAIWALVFVLLGLLLALFGYSSTIELEPLAAVLTVIAPFGFGAAVGAVLARVGAARREPSRQDLAA